MRNQILLTLMYFDVDNLEDYCVLLKESLKKTKDYKGHIRLYNTLDKLALSKKMTAKFVNEMIDISIGMNLGKGVKSAIEELDIN